MKTFPLLIKWLVIVVVALLVAAPFAWLAANPEPDAVLADGGRYFGALVDGRPHGEGRLEWRNGRVYEGTFKRGLFHGEGRERRADGGTFEGEYRHGQPHGTGRSESPDGTVYEGEFREGLGHGQGRIEHRRYIWEGEVRRNRIEGRGRMERADGRVYEGVFEDYEPVRDITYTDGSGTRYEGAMEDWQFHGKGRLTTAAGGIYEGRFERGSLVGEGTYEGPDGRRYTGDFERMQFHGEGRLELANGDVYEGGFFFGDYHGEGTLKLAEPDEQGRKVLSGDWIHGRRVEEQRAQAGQTRLNVEKLLYNQHALLEEALNGIEAGLPGQADMYLLAVGGDGSEEVFRREVAFISELLDRDFGTRGRSLMLVNSRSTVDQYPMATATSLERALSGLAGRMDPSEDILFVYLTSHGSRNHELTIAQNGMQLPDLSAERLGELLNEQPFTWKVVVVSACYSGGFIDHLKGDGTLVMTAARHDRTSFGCEDTAEMTWFGEAYFRDALPRATSFQDAFDLAAEQVLAREEAEGIAPHSRPQIDEGAEIAGYLQGWWSRVVEGGRRP